MLVFKIQAPMWNRNLKVCGEILFNDTSTITQFVNVLRAKMHEIEISNIQQL